MERKDVKKLCESLWREVVVRRAGCCEICQSRRNLHGHHVIPKSSGGLRAKFDPENGVCLCADCHRYPHGNADQRAVYFQSLRRAKGKLFYTDLQERYRQVDKVTTEELVEMSKVLLAELEAL